MTGTLLIDNIDIFSAFGVGVADGGYAGLVQYPALKAVPSNDWHEEDGIEVDLSEPVLDSKEFAMQFIVYGDMSDFPDFVELFAGGAYHDFDFREIGCTRRLRMVSNPDLITINYAGKFTIQFADDFPLDGYIYESPASAIFSTRDYDFDGKYFADYGVQVTDGTLDNILKSPAVKQNLLRNIGAKSGATYDGQNVTFQSKDVQINCVMRADSLVEFWRNYSAFIYDLIRPGEHKLYAELTGEEYPCYYKSCSVGNFVVINGAAWFDFAITLCFTSFRLNEIEYLLATEYEAIIITEDEEYAIDMKSLKA